MGLTRRSFIKRTLAAAALPVIVPSSVLGAEKEVPPSERIALGFVGLGSHGVGVNLKSFLQEQDAQVVAMCDVDAKHLQNALKAATTHYDRRDGAGKFQCFTTGDWREVVSRSDVDAVVVSTPDHWHVLISMAAIEAGKDVICEKPLSLTVREGRVLSDTVRRHRRVFQTATENRSKGNFLRACELVRNGRIGKLHTIRTQLPRGPGARGSIKAWKPEPVPDHFDYDMWLGQAPEAPYTPARCHYTFRYHLDYSGGMLTDWGAHVNDVAQWGNNTEYTGPVSVEGHGDFPEDGLFNTATDWELNYRYANGVDLICTSGGTSVRFEGADGWVSVPDWGRACCNANNLSLCRPTAGPTPTSPQ